MVVWDTQTRMFLLPENLIARLQLLLSRQQVQYKLFVSCNLPDDFAKQPETNGYLFERLQVFLL